MNRRQDQFVKQQQFQKEEVSAKACDGCTPPCNHQQCYKDCDDCSDWVQSGLSFPWSRGRRTKYALVSSLLILLGSILFIGIVSASSDLLRARVVAAFAYAPLLATSIAAFVFYWTQNRWCGYFSTDVYKKIQIGVLAFVGTTLLSYFAMAVYAAPLLAALLAIIGFGLMLNVIRQGWCDFDGRVYATIFAATIASAVQIAVSVYAFERR